MKTTLIIAALCIGLSAAHTQEEIERKGREVMEEYRKDRGHWIFLNSQGMVDHMVDHIGANGLAFAGFFISKKHYRDAEVSPPIARARALPSNCTPCAHTCRPRMHAVTHSRPSNRSLSRAAG